MADFEEISALENQEKCIKQFVLNAEKNAKFLSSQQKASQFFARNVIERKEDSDFSVS